MAGPPAKPAAEGDAAPEGEGKKTSKLKLILILVVLLLFVVGGGLAAGVMFLGLRLPFMAPPPAKEEVVEDPVEVAKREAAAREAEKAKEREVQKALALRAIFVQVPSMVVNLADRDARRYARLVLTVEVLTPESEMAVKENMPRIIDAFQIYVRSQTSENFGSVANILQVRRDLLTRLNRIDPRIDARSVLFQDLVVQ
jgi:flagellar FliL protein